MAAIVEEYAAAAEEISAATEKQNINIIKISKFSKDMDSVGRELSTVLESNE